MDLRHIYLFVALVIYLPSLHLVHPFYIFFCELQNRDGIRHICVTGGLSVPVLILLDPSVMILLTMVLF